MSRRTVAVSNINRGKNIKESLSEFGNDLSDIYGKSALLNFSMNYANYFMATREKEFDRSFSGISGRINELVKKLAATESFSDDYITEAEKIREEVKKRVDAATAFLSAFENFNYVISRKLPDASYDGVDIDIDEEARKILEFIFGNDDNMAINARLQKIISELPVRYTKSRFMDIVASSVERYAGSEKRALKAFSYIVRQAGMIYGLEEIEGIYPELMDELEYFKSYEFDSADKKELFAESEKLGKIISRCSDLSDDGMVMMEAANNLYAALLNFGKIDKEEVKAELEMIEFTVRSFENEDIGQEEFDVKTAEIFTKLEGRPEELFEEIAYCENTLSVVENKYMAELEEIGAKDLYDILFKCRILNQGSLFADLEELSDTGTASAKDLAELKALLTEEFGRIFGEVDRSLRRAIIAQVIGSVPVYFENRTEVMNYVRTSLSSCGSREELTGTINAIRAVMCE